MYLSQEALSNLKKYKYQSGEYSFMDNVLTPFWNKIVNYLPLWLAPNLVTFIGLLVTIISCLLYLPSDLTLTESFHPFYYLFSAISLFIYQTLDAIDGKQARRTMSSSSRTTFWPWMRCYLLRFECLYSMLNIQTWHLNTIFLVLYWPSHSVFHQQLGRISYKDNENKPERYRYNWATIASNRGHAHTSYFWRKIKWNNNEKFWISYFTDSRRVNR